MLDGLRHRLSSRVGSRTRFPPPGIASGDAALRLKDDLEDFYVDASARFVRLFLHGKPLPVQITERAWFAEYERAGLVREQIRGIYAPCVRVFPLLGAMVATDLLTHREEDQVFSLMLEQVYLVRNLTVRPDDRVLELCVGSGVNSLFASDHAGAVTGVDVSERALAFARFNAALNPGAVGIDLLHGSLFEPVGPDARFDVVIVNPPFELVPPGTSHFLHSHGGADGMDVVREILVEAPRRLESGGRFEMVTWSPGDGERLVLDDLLEAAFPARRIEVHTLRALPLDTAIAPFRGRPGYAAWRDDLNARGVSNVCLVYVRVADGEPAALERREPGEEVRLCVEIVEEWS